MHQHWESCLNTDYKPQTKKGMCKRHINPHINTDLGNPINKTMNYIVLAFRLTYLFWLGTLVIRLPEPGPCCSHLLPAFWALPQPGLPLAWGWTQPSNRTKIPSHCWAAASSTKVLDSNCETGNVLPHRGTSEGLRA